MRLCGCIVTLWLFGLKKERTKCSIKKVLDRKFVRSESTDKDGDYFLTGNTKGISDTGLNQALK